MEIREKRRSDRVEVAIRVEVEGFEVDGQQFWEKTCTTEISRHGAAILLTRKLAPDQELTLRNLDNRKQAEFRVVGIIREGETGIVYGFALVNPDDDFWDVHFPPLTEGEIAASRILLKCANCHLRQVAHLDEIETDVFLANQSLNLYCKRCKDSTVWKETIEEPDASDSLSARPAIPPPQAQAQTGREKRKHPRVRVQMKVCIRRPGHRDEVADCVDVSRGGICFESASHYELGDRIEVATHYRPGAPAIFIIARVVYVAELPRYHMHRYGVSYVTEFEAQLVR